MLRDGLGNPAVSYIHCPLSCLPLWLINGGLSAGLQTWFTIPRPVLSLNVSGMKPWRNSNLSGRGGCWRSYGNNGIGEFLGVIIDTEWLIN